METGKNITQTRTNLFSIVQNYTRCYSDNDTKIATSGSSFSANITIQGDGDESNMTVSVTMGGVDITSTAYSNKTITIAAITGDVVITITCPRLASGYYENGSLVYDWATLKTTYPNAFATTETISGNSGSTYFADLTGKLIVDDEITTLGAGSFGGTNCKLTGLYLPDTITTYGSVNVFGSSAMSLSEYIITGNVVGNFDYPRTIIDRIVISPNFGANVTTMPNISLHTIGLKGICLINLSNVIKADVLEHIKTYIPFVYNTPNISMTDKKYVSNGIVYAKKSATYLIAIGVDNSVTYTGDFTFDTNCKEVYKGFDIWANASSFSGVTSITFNGVDRIGDAAFWTLIKSTASNTELIFYDTKFIGANVFRVDTGTSKMGDLTFGTYNCQITQTAFKRKGAASKTIYCLKESYTVLNYDWAADNITANFIIT